MTLLYRPYQYVCHSIHTCLVFALLGALIWSGTATGFVCLIACSTWAHDSSCARKRSFSPWILERAA